MKTKLLFSRIQNCKNGILSFLIIFFMTITSFSQENGIEFEFDCNAIVKFGQPDISGTYFVYPEGTAFDGGGSTIQMNWFVVYEPSLNRWELKGPTTPDGSGTPVTFFVNNSTAAFPSDNVTDWGDAGAGGGFPCTLINITFTASGDPDNDGDGFPASVDCNDNDPTVNTAITYYVDADGDGFGTTAVDLCSSTVPSGYAAVDGDCNDGDAAINPNATEICDGVDNNCDGNVDEGLTFTTYYVDADGDSFGDEADAGTDFCSNPGVGYSLTNDDCDDSESQANPGLEEIPFDTIDNDCDGEIDEDDNPPVVYEYCDNKQKKVLICHKGKTKCVSINAVDAHLAHDDYLGSCGSGREGEILAEERPTSYDLVSWPNPTNDLFNVKMISPNYEDTVSLKAFDINGRLIYSDKINANEDYQFGYNLQAGIYFVKITQGNTSNVIKVMKR